MARSMWTLFEPVHAVTYFAAEARSAYEQAGLRGFWRGYFAGRAAPLGVTGTGGAAVVAASFFNFAPAFVARAIPGVWELITPQEAASYEYSPAEQMFVRDRFAGQAVGSPETVRTELQGLLDRTKADELMLTTMVYDIKDRARSFELVAEKVANDLTG